MAVACVRVERGGRHWGTVSAVEARLGPAFEAERPLSSTRPVPSANWLTRSGHERAERPQLPRGASVAFRLARRPKHDRPRLPHVGVSFPLPQLNLGDLLPGMGVAA